MHIAIDVRSLMEGRHSGVEEYTTRIINAMSKVRARHHYHLFYNAAKEVDLPRFRENVSVHAFRYPNKVFNTSQLLFHWPKWDRMIPVPIDVFFIPNPRLVPLAAGTPFVTVAHDISYERFPEFLTWKRKLWHIAMQPRKLLERSSRIVAVSEHTKNDIIENYNISSDRISVVYPGVPNSPVSSPAHIHQVRMAYNLPEQFILFFGALEPRKNVPAIIEAFSAIADRVPHHLIIAGESGWKAKKINEVIARSQYRDRIHMIGFVNEQDKSALYAAADLFIYPSFYEGFGFPPLESLLAGTPVVVSFNASLPEVVGQWATLIDPYNTPHLALVLAELLRSPKRVPLNVRKQILEKYSWERSANQIVDILEKVANK
ncbi:MAG TPA: glycosyltransferase family 1 protein [Candidatus Andersenbacteria bacterium]|nr:glycosyltransferase family 1 protein [Candidatus Andersenbacteria bacterium]